MQLMRTIVLGRTQRLATDAEPLNFVEQFQPASPDVAESVSGADWPHLDTVPAALGEDAECPWKQSAFR